mgnify:CR=1 FL=1|jgi:tRNA 2-thiouridine synthesizing protein E
MPIIEHKGARFEVDDEGFLLRSEDWSEQVAQALADREGLGELNQHQMELVRFIREYYQRMKAFPILRAVCFYVHQGKDCFRDSFLPPLKAWKVAGLPKPDTVMRTYLESEGTDVPT